MDLEGIMLSEISQTEKENSIGSLVYVESKKQNKTKLKQTHRYREQKGGCQRGEKWGGQNI